MNVPDIVILVIVGFSSIFGLWRGFVREVLAVIAWIAAILIARLYSPLLVPYFEGITDSETGRSILAFAVLGFGTLFIGSLIIKFMTRLISMAGMQLTDRLLGMVFGFARGVIIVAVVIYFAHERFDTESWWVESRAIPYVDMVIDRAGFAPGATSAAV
ncbi:MAG: CvpA family protein [Pseudohongiella sp.]|nr:CvpA family protein [Pseudohongiella sp.]